jgi:transcriptional regulator with XRE-family HTH domain
MTGNFDIERAGTRLRIARYIMNISRPELCSKLGMKPERLRSLEGLRQKMNEIDIRQISTLWPILTDFITTNGPIRLDPSDKLIISLVSNYLLSNDDKLEQSQKIKDIAGIDTVRAALTLPTVRKAVHQDLAKIVNQAMKDAFYDAS